MNAPAKKRQADLDQVVVNQMFDMVDRNHDGLLQVDELEQWLKRHAWMAVIFVHNDVKSSKSELPAVSSSKQAKATAKVSSFKGKGASRREDPLRTKLVSHAGSTEGTKVLSRRVSAFKAGRRASIDHLQEEFRDALNTHSSKFKEQSVSLVTTTERTSEFKKLATAHKSRINAVAKQSVITDLIVQTKFEFRDMRELRLAFALHCHQIEEDVESGSSGQRRKRKRYVLSRDECKSLLVSKLDKLKEGKVLDRVCDLFDKVW
jgi:hypothetical protein